MSTSTESASALDAFWRTVTKVDHSKINTWIAFRNALAVALPLGIGIAIHNPLGAVAVTVGALNVAYSDGTDPYRHRASRMLLWTILSAVAVFVGSATGAISWLAVLVAVTWAFGSGMSVSISSKAGDLGLNTLVSVIIFAARGANTVTGSLETAGLVLAGGLLQTAFALFFWPLRRHDPQRRVLGEIYQNLSKEVNPQNAEAFESQLHAPSQLIQDTLDAIGRDHSVEGERFRLLSDQTDRIRMSSFVVRQLRDRLRDGARSGQTIHAVSILDEVLQVCSALLQTVGSALTSARVSDEQQVLLRRLDTGLRAASKLATENESVPPLPQIAPATAALAGQLRVVAALSADATPDGAERFEREEGALPSWLRIGSWIGTLRANLNWNSSSFRHAVRLAVCVGIGDAIGRMVSWQRSYWIPMTIAVVLKPDFATTFSRGVLRLAGTFAGLLIATGLYHLLPQSSPSELAVTELFLVGLYTYALRSIGPANYGVFSIAISGLIVFLVAATGISPKDVVAQRAINTAAGGLFALIAYAAWPTWERTQSHEVLAQMLDRIRDYFHAIVVRIGSKNAADGVELDHLRTAWRRARSNAEATVDRMAAEPGVKADQLSCMTSILASSRSMVRAMIGIEAMLLHKGGDAPPAAFGTFAQDVEFTLYFAANALRGSQAASDALPVIREDQRRLADELDDASHDDEVLLNESDRLTVALNTLREQVQRCVAHLRDEQLSGRYG